MRTGKIAGAFLRSIFCLSLMFSHSAIGQEQALDEAKQLNQKEGMNFIKQGSMRKQYHTQSKCLR